MAGRRAPPAWELLARKDIFRIGDAPDSTRSVDIAIRFREFMGSYVEHCHNTQHEDHAQLLRWDPRADSSVGRRLLQAIIRVGAKLKDPSARN